MGYEIFVRKIFPFVGNQYNDVEESSEQPLPPGVKSITLYGSVFLSPEEEMWYFDLAHCTIGIATEETLPIGVLACTAKGGEQEGELILGLLVYASEKTAKIAYGETIGEPLPWEAIVVDRDSSQTSEGELTIDDIANASELQLVWGDEFPNGFTTEEKLGHYTEDELRALKLCTIYYKK